MSIYDENGNLQVDQNEVITNLLKKVNQLTLENSVLEAGIAQLRKALDDASAGTKDKGV